MKLSLNRSSMFSLSGALSGIFAVLVFTIVHQLFISDIWFSFLPMLIAGGLCGFLVSWSYSLLVPTASLRSWVGYNFTYVILFGILGAISILIFEPVTSMASVVNLNGPPTELINQAMPLTIVFTISMAVLITLLFRGKWLEFGAVLLTCIVLVALLGLNVTAIGLVSIPVGDMYIIAEMGGLIAVLNVAFLIGCVVMQWQQFTLKDVA